MTQQSFDFAPSDKEDAKDIQKWVDRHNQQVVDAAKTLPISPGSLLSALDGHEAKANSVYLMRTILGQCLRKSLVPGVVPFKKSFLQALRAEISIKKTAQDPAVTVRDILIKMQATR